MDASITVKSLIHSIRTDLRTVACSALLAQLVFIPIVFAGPTGGNIVAGQGNINQSGLNTTVNQNSARLAIDWQTFNVNRNESVNFNQPDVSSIALNRILDQNPSQILGSINANGQIILANPNGVFFGKDSTVNAGGLFAAALDIDPQDFMEGRLDFKALENTTGLIVNQGWLQVIDGSTLALLGQQVRNEGLLVANFGTVALASGSDIKVRFDELEHLSVQIGQGRLADILELDDPAILNSGVIEAHGGRVVLTARQARAIQNSIYSDDNRAFSFTEGTVVEKGGVIYLAGPDGDISGLDGDIVDSGTIDVSSDSGDAGSIIYDAMNIRHSGTINADSGNGDGGQVTFNATDTAMLTGNSSTSAQSLYNGQGGTVHVLGNHVGLTDNATIDASGSKGGGEVLIGGDYQGNNPDIKNAEAVYLDKQTSIHADATENGNGGKVIVWSDKATHAFGTLTATGGQQGGNGGFIETSSKNNVDLIPIVDVHATNGQHGEWLIDPSNIVIDNTDYRTPRTGNVFESTINNSFLNVVTLRDTLSSGANITVQTAIISGTCAPQPCTPAPDDQLEPAGGNITLSSDLDLDGMPGDGARSLTLNAHHNITIDAQIGELATGGSGTQGNDYLNLTLNADTNNSGGGSVTVNQAIDLDGGNLVVTGAAFTNNASITTVNTTDPVDAPGGDITVNVDNAASLGDLATDNASGNLSVTAGSIDGGQLSVAGDTTLTATGTITLNDAGNDFGDDVTVNNGTTVTLHDTNSLTLGDVNATNLTVSAANNLTQTNGTAIDVGGTSNLTAGNNIALTQNNNLGTSIAVNAGNNATLVDNGAVNLAASTIGGAFDLTAGSSITDSGDVDVNGAATFRVPTGSDVILDSAGNTLNSTVQFLINGAPGNINNLRLRNDAIGGFTLQDNLNIDGDLNLRARSLTLNNLSLGNTGTLTLTTDNGDIDQSAAIVHSGATVLNANGNINFTRLNHLASVRIDQAGTATIVNGTNALTLDGIINTTDLNIIATGGITETAAIDVTGTATFDTGNNALTLDNNTHQFNIVQIDSAGNVQIQENDNINISGSMASLTLSAGLNNVAADVANTTDNTLTVSGTTTVQLQNGGNVDFASFTDTQSNNLQGAINFTTANGTLDTVAIRNSGDMQLNNVSTVNSLALNSQGTITQTGNLIVNDSTNLQAASINLQGSNDFNNVIVTDSGTVNINDTAGGITVNAANTNGVNSIELAISASGPVNVEGDMLNLDITSNGNIQNTNALFVENTTTLNSGTTGNVNFQAQTVDLNNVIITAADSVSISEANSINLSGNVATLDVTTTAGDINNGTGRLVVSGNTRFDSGTNDIHLDNAANDFNRVEIQNARDVALRDANGITLQNVNARNVQQTTNGHITQSSGTRISSIGIATLDSGSGNIQLNQNNLLTSVSLAGNAAELVNDQAVELTDSTVIDMLDVTTRNGNLSVHRLQAGNSIRLNAADTLLDANGDGVNLIANNAQLVAANGIGHNSSIETQVDHLSVHNTDHGDISIENSGGNITLDSIRNDATDTGNFNFRSTHDVYVDNITLQQHLTEAFYPDGSGTVNMFTADGSFLGVGDLDMNHADITASNLRLVGVRGTLGTLQRPMVLNISGKVELLMRASLDPRYTPPAPAPEDIQDNSIIQFTAADTLAAVNGVQVTEVETLLDISPAIFTDLRHFVAAQDPVMLPRDQWFDNGYTDEDDEEYFRRLEESGSTQTPGNSHQQL